MKQENRPPRILYWKWDDSHIDSGSYRAGIDDLCERSCFDTVFICTHWCRDGLSTKKTHDAVLDACRLLHARGKKLILEIDARSEKERFCTAYPEARTGIVYWKELPADEEHADFSIRQASGADLFAGDRQSGELLLCVYRYRRTEQGYEPGTLRELTQDCGLTRTGPDTVRVSLPGGSDAAEHIFAAVVSWYQANDLASDAHEAFNRELFAAYADIPLDGAAVDELSYMTSPFFDFTPGSYQKWDEHPYYSHALDARYQAQYRRSLRLDYLNRFIGNAADPNEQLVSINCYHAFIRQITINAEQTFYQNVKSTFGSGAFVGVHPTWFAIEETDNTPEVWKNGIDWWGVPRDYGFTDEIMLYPVRLALTHKAEANVFYNMWYGEGAGFLTSFFKEIYRNARYGGRTISLAYECRFERVVQQLCRPGELEAVSQCEQRVRALDHVQHAPAASDVLIIMGVPAACNAKYNQNVHGTWDTYGSVFKRVFSLARGLWDAGYNCDLVGSYEIDSGAIRLLPDGTAQYGSQTFHFVLYAYPQFATQSEQVFLQELAGRKLPAAVISELDTGFSGEDLTALGVQLRSSLFWCSDNPEISDLTALLAANHIRTYRLPCGCVLQDGSMIFTAPDAAAPSGNPLFTELSVEGRQIRIDAQDFVFLKLAAGGIQRLEGPAIRSVHIDGKPVVSFASYQLVSLHTLTLAFLGDSVTEGCFETYEAPDHTWQCVMDPDAVYHAQLRPMLQDYLRGHGSHAGVRIINAGIGGNTSREGLARLEPDVLRYRPDITVVCFGLNDVHGGDAGLGAYQDRLREIFRALRRAGSMPVFMTPNMMCTGTTARYAACPPLREMQAHCCALQLNGQVDRYMQAARDVCEEARVPVCDCYALWKERFSGGEDITALLSNEINHPSRPLHRLFAEQLLHVLLREGLLDQALQETD